MSREVFAAVADALERGEPAALVTIVSTTGSTPRSLGAKMLVFGDGRIVGTIGGGCYENDAFGKAREAILSRAPQLVHYELDDDFAQETGLICGGQMDVYIEPIEPSPELYIVGAGHVGFHLARIADEVGFRVHVADDREKFANAPIGLDIGAVTPQEIAGSILAELIAVKHGKHHSPPMNWTPARLKQAVGADPRVHPRADT